MIRLCVGEYECNIHVVMRVESGCPTQSLHIAVHVLIITTVHQLIIILIHFSIVQREARNVRERLIV